MSEVPLQHLYRNQHGHHVYSRDTQHRHHSAERYPSGMELPYPPETKYH